MSIDNEKSGSGKGRKYFIILVLLLAVGGGFLYLNTHFHTGGEESAAANEKYTCGMHPFIIQDKPGDCPICGMKLTKIIVDPNKAEQSQAVAPKEDDFFADVSTQQGERKILFYRNPMNPAITSKVPAKDEMGMDYVPIYEEAPQNKTVAGYSTVTIGTDTAKLLGVQTVLAKVSDIKKTVRAVGVVAADETRIHNVQTKIGGFIEKLNADFEGKEVRKGQPLVTIYSPEYLSYQQEYLNALTLAEKSKNSGDQMKAFGSDVLASARKKLELLDIPKDFVDNLEKSRQTTRTVTLIAPASGFVTKKEVFEGQKIEPGMTILELTDLSRVWVDADLFENEVVLVKKGQKAAITIAGGQAGALKGAVEYVYPTLNPDTRTVKVRFSFPNPQNMLKIGMFADVNIDLVSRRALVIPDNAVIDTGVRKVVFVAVGPNTYKPREITIGASGEGLVEVLEGVGEGEAVVTKANFIVDSESRFRAAFQSVGGQ